jgi:hypothetical protein
MPPKPFKPPRPSNVAPKKSTKPRARKSTSTSTPIAKPRASGSNSLSRPSLPQATNSDSESDPFATLHSDIEIDVDEIVEQEEEEERREKIPPELLTRLLHEFFKEDGTRISQDANVAVGRYMETFVREALARAAHMRAGMAEGGDGFLEVEDLEKLGPQLLLDF